MPSKSRVLSWLWWIVTLHGCINIILFDQCQWSPCLKKWKMEGRDLSIILVEGLNSLVGLPTYLTPTTYIMPSNNLYMVGLLELQFSQAVHCSEGVSDRSAVIWFEVHGIGTKATIFLFLYIIIWLQLWSSSSDTKGDKWVVYIIYVSSIAL